MSKGFEKINRNQRIKLEQNCSYPGRQGGVGLNWRKSQNAWLLEPYSINKELTLNVLFNVSSTDLP